MVTTTRIKKMLGVDLDQAREILTEFAKSHPEVGLFYAVENSTEDGIRIRLVEQKSLCTTGRAHLYAVKNIQKEKNVTLNEENGPLDLKKVGRKYVPLDLKQQTLTSLWGIKEKPESCNDSASKSTINASSTTQMTIRDFCLQKRNLQPKSRYEIRLNEEFENLEKGPDTTERSPPPEDSTKTGITGNGIESLFPHFFGIFY